MKVSEEDDFSQVTTASQTQCPQKAQETRWQVWARAALGSLLWEPFYFPFLWPGSLQSPNLHPQPNPTQPNPNHRLGHTLGEPVQMVPLASVLMTSCIGSGDNDWDMGNKEQVCPHPHKSVFNQTFPPLLSLAPYFPFRLFLSSFTSSSLLSLEKGGLKAKGNNLMRYHI